MPISQLLASITGEKAATPSSIQTSRPANGVPPKRKADQDGPGSALKTPKVVSASNGPANSGASRPYTGSSRPSSSNPTRTLSERPASAALKKPALGSVARPSPTSASFPAAARSTAASSAVKRSTPPITAPSAMSDSAKAPKKGSIAEIRARAAAQQAKLQGLGKIQHKAGNKPMTKKERDEAAAEEAKAMKKGFKPTMKSGAGGLPSRTAPGGLQRIGNGNGHLDRTRGAIQKPGTGKLAKTPVQEERKVKKAALATTGYRGSARPVAGKGKPSADRPGAPGASRGANQGRDKRPNPMGMFSKPRRQEDDDYDEELDDFVVDDEEEEEEGPAYGGRYKYAADSDESDMEAGFSDVEDENTAAERAARLEDAREEQILAQKKRDKEARRKAALQNRR